MIEASSTGAHYAVIFGIVVPAIVSVAAAAFATWEARRARQSEREAEQSRVMEARVSAHRYEVYEPMIATLAGMLRGKAPSKAQFEKITDNFNSWVLVYGSDQAITAWGRLMQATYESAPALILVRLYAEFFVAARRDLGDEKTTVDNVAVLAPRITDLYKNQAYYYAITADEEELFHRLSWQPPWRRTYEQMNDDWAETIGSLATPTESEPQG
jgi:hypothetical protein